MPIIKWIERFMRAILPSPFSIAILLTILVVLLAFAFGTNEASGKHIAQYWQDGLFDSGMLVFAFQMMLMLVLGHALALTRVVDLILRRATLYCTNSANAAFLVTFLTVLVAFFNWGLALIFGAVFARKVAEHASREGIKMNYPLIGAAGYSGLLVWHGGISGSAPIKVAENSHLRTMMTGLVNEEEIDLIPEVIPLSETVFGTMNISATISLLLLLPLFMFWLGRRFPGQLLDVKNTFSQRNEVKQSAKGAERIDYLRVFSFLAGSIVFTIALFNISGSNWKNFSFITPNFINQILLGLCLILHANISAFLRAIDVAISGASGILIQFPLYFGIMGIMNQSGLIALFSDGFIAISSQQSFPLWSFFSAGLVNIFVPSGGGQWAVQGPIIIKAALELGVSFPKAVMALAYGDQLTNMLQPFWALPLLGITGLSARSILPYSALLMGVGLVIFTTVLMIF
jgi:short-chain fatty acids transporter